MFKKFSIFVLSFSFLLLTGCVENRYGTPADEVLPDETVADEEITDETEEELPLEEELPEEGTAEITTEDVIDDEGEASEITESEEEQSCVFSSECPEDRDLCFEGECSTLDEVFEKYTDCGPESDSKFNCPSECEGCKDGKLSCLTILNGDYDFKICADCATSYSCKEGYECDSLKHKCILMNN